MKENLPPNPRCKNYAKPNDPRVISNVSKFRNWMYINWSSARNLSNAIQSNQHIKYCVSRNNIFDNFKTERRDSL